MPNTVHLNNNSTHTTVQMKIIYLHGFISYIAPLFRSWLYLKVVRGPLKPRLPATTKHRPSLPQIGKSIPVGTCQPWLDPLATAEGVRVGYKRVTAQLAWHTHSEW